MKERPILFSGPMVQAILDGTKTQTRRVAKPEHFAGTHMPPESALRRALEYGAICPYGMPGDALWVRETWAPACTGGYDARDDGGLYWYRASDEGECEGPWRPSIFMPREACRITLEITDVRVERLQEISEAHARAEGVVPLAECAGSYSYAYAQLWDHLNAKRGFGWKINPWVWVVVFRRIERQPEEPASHGHTG